MFVSFSAAETRQSVFLGVRPLNTTFVMKQGEHDHHRPQAAPHQGVGPPQGEFVVRLLAVLA